MNVGDITAFSNSEVRIGGIAGFCNYTTSLDVYNIGSLNTEGEGTAYCGGVFGLIWVSGPAVSRRIFE